MCTVIECAQFEKNGTPPASKDGVFNCSEQLRLTVHSGALSRMARTSTVHCQSELQGTVENRFLLAGGVAFYILRCCKVDHLQTSKYSLQDKYKGEATNTTENVQFVQSVQWVQFVQPDWAVLPSRYVRPWTEYLSHCHMGIQGTFCNNFAMDFR